MWVLLKTSLSGKDEFHLDFSLNNGMSRFLFLNYDRERTNGR